MGLFDNIIRHPTITSEETQQALEQLDDDESLTRDIEDEGAKILLLWGKDRVQKWVETPPLPLLGFDTFTRQVRLMLRTSSSLTTQRTELTEAEFLAKLTQLLDMAFSPPPEEK